MEETLERKPDCAQTKKKSKRRGPRLTGVSRQRRMANARERTRVQVLNENIERLRDLIPLFPGEKKPSKTETIRLAAVYISCLTEILESTPERRIKNEEIPTLPGLEHDIGFPSICFDAFPEIEGNFLDLDLGEYMWEDYN